MFEATLEQKFYFGVPLSVRRARPLRCCIVSPAPVGLSSQAVTGDVINIEMSFYPHLHFPLLSLLHLPNVPAFSPLLLPYASLLHSGVYPASTP